MAGSREEGKKEREEIGRQRKIKRKKSAVSNMGGWRKEGERTDNRVTMKE